jgi:cystathionine beta-lyase family protein involved in aluminum resistance
MRPDDFKFYFVEGTKTTSKEVYKILKEADALIYETGRNDTYCKFNDGRKRYIGIRIRSESEVKDDSTKTRSDVKHVMITSPKKVVKTVLTNAIRDEIIELAFGGMDAYELSKTFNIEVRTIKNILNGLA